MPSSSAKTLISGYLVVQAIVVGFWWVLLLRVPSAIAIFQPVNWPAESLLSFGLADTVFAIVGSLLAAYATATQKPWANMAVWSLAGAISYASLCCIGASIVTNDAWFASALMVMMAGATLAMATMFGTQATPELFRTQRKTARAAYGWTFFQIIIFWSIFLWIIPNGINELMHRLVGSFGFFTPLGPIGLSLFLLASTLGLWSGTTMAIVGRGTPLPTSNAPVLVVAGPYRWVRNPMALAGILQGIAVGIWTGSIWIILYAILGGILWHVTARPAEEQELLARFDEPYREYCTKVGLWLPRW